MAVDLAAVQLTAVVPVVLAVLVVVRLITQEQ
jgi:hypothetical protein